eukprot:362671-Chlamydomonas_euryale.AAC.4
MHRPACPGATVLHCQGLHVPHCLPLCKCCTLMHPHALPRTLTDYDTLFAIQGQKLSLHCLPACTCVPSSNKFTPMDWLQLKGLYVQLNDDHKGLQWRYDALHEERINVEKQYQVWCTCVVLSRPSGVSGRIVAVSCAAILVDASLSVFVRQPVLLRTPGVYEDTRFLQGHPVFKFRAVVL